MKPKKPYCVSFNSRVVWLLNGSLAEAETSGLLNHSSGCLACQNTIQEALEAAEFWSIHLSLDSLQSIALGEEAHEPEARHLSECEACQADLETLRRSAEAIGLSVVAPQSLRLGGSVARTAYLKLAAGLLALAGVGGALTLSSGPQERPGLKTRSALLSANDFESAGIDVPEPEHGLLSSITFEPDSDRQDLANTY